MLKKSITAKDVCDFLNDLLAIDPMAISNIVNHHATCSLEMLDHPTVQVTADDRVGIIGILNGLFGVNNEGRGPIAYIQENDRVIRFLPTPTPKSPQ